MGVITKYLYIASLALLIYMPFHIFLSQWLSSGTGGLNAWKVGKDVFAALLVAACVGAVLWKRKYTRLYWWVLGLAAGYAALHFLLVATTSQPGDTGLLATVYNTRLFWYVLIGYSVALLAPKLVQPKRLIKLLLLLSTVVCLAGLLQWVFPKDIMTHFGYSIERGVKPNFFIDDKPDLPRVFSTLRDPNSLGAYLILPSALLFYGLIRFWKTNKQMLIGGLLLLHGLIVFLTFGRAAWLGTLAAGAVTVGLYKAKLIRKLLRKYAPLLAVGLLLLAGLVFVLKDQYIVQNVVFHSDENTRQTDSNNLHIIQIQKGLDGIASQPLGHGPGTAGLVSVHNEKGGLLTENYFVQVAYEVGILGLALLVALMVLILRRLWLIRQEPLALALIASFAGLTLMNMLLHTWANEAVAASWFMLAGLALADGRNAPRAAVRQKPVNV